jgi:hypothetical protein
MHQHRLLQRLPLALLCVLSLAACLENEETIEVRRDGSVKVTVRAEGDRADLAGGYPVPLLAPWAPADAAARTWIDRLGADTGSRAVMARAAALDWRAAFGLGQDDKLALTAEAEFASVADWPRFAAPEDEPYRTAFLERGASLSVEDKGDRLVYTFERTYHGRAYAGFDLLDRLKGAFTGELKERLDELEPLSNEELAAVTEIARREHERLAASLARAATDLVYTQGSAALPPEAAARARSAGAGAVSALFSTPFVDDLWSDVRAYGAVPEEDRDTGLPSPLEDLDEQMRDALRGAFEASLRADGLTHGVVNEALSGLEWAFARYDHTLDLGDEEFAVKVALPGTIVAGNFDALVDGRAAWKFSFDALRDRTVVLRAVSVLPQ